MNLEAYLVRQLSTLVSIPSVTGSEAKCAAHIHRYLRGRGLKATKDRYGNVVCIKANGPGPTILFNGHIDTVPPTDAWTRDPYKPVVEGDKLYGLGASDCKAGLAALMHLAEHVEVPGTMIYTFTVAEETSRANLPNGARTIAPKYKADYAIAVESGVTPEGEPAIMIGCQGQAWAEVCVLGKAAHSSMPHRGENAIYSATALVRAVEAHHTTLKPVRVWGDVSVMPSMSVTQIRTDNAANVIPDKVVLTINRRLAPGETFAKFQKEIGRCVRGIRHTVAWKNVSQPVATKPRGALLKTTVGVMEGLFGRVNARFSTGRYDLCYFADTCGDSINLGPGTLGEAHTADEFVIVSGMVKQTRFLEAVVRELAGGDAETGRKR